jgi:multidrug/hemolysin transport system permease protein
MIDKMKTLGVLVRRNMMVFCKDKENVFYSTLAMLIIILLMLVFLGKMNVDMVKDAINDIDHPLFFILTDTLHLVLV